MFRSTSTGFNKYDVSERTGQTAKMWENENMYKTSYFKQSDKNVRIVLNKRDKAFSNEKFHRTISADQVKQLARREFEGRVFQKAS